MFDFVLWACWPCLFGLNSTGRCWIMQQIPHTLISQWMLRCMMWPLFNQTNSFLVPCSLLPHFAERCKHKKHQLIKANWDKSWQTFNHSPFSVPHCFTSALLIVRDAEPGRISYMLQGVTISLSCQSSWQLWLNAHFALLPLNNNSINTLTVVISNFISRPAD